MTATLSRMGRPKNEEQTENVRLPQSTVKKVRRVALHLGITPGAYIADRIAEVLDRDDAARMEDERLESEQNDKIESQQKKPKK